MKPTLLLIPGLSGTTTLMEWIKPHLELYFTLCFIALPNSKAEGDQEYEVLCDAIEQQYLSQIEGNSIWLLGESFSGPIAITLAKRHPERIMGVILAATFATRPNHQLKKPKKNLLGLLIDLGRDQIATLFLTSQPAFRLSHAMRESITLSLNETPQDTVIKRINVILDCDVRDKLPLDQPVLYLQAKNDWIVRPHALKEIQEVQSKMEVICFDAPHLLLQSKPKETASAIQKFIEKHSNSI